MAVLVRSQPYRIDPPKEGPEDVKNLITNIDEMLAILFEDVKLVADAVGDGGGVTSVVNDTNVTGSISGSQLTLGFTGELAVSRGGTGVGSFTPYAVILGGTTGTADLQDVGAVGTAGDILTSAGAGAKPTWQAASGGTVEAVPFASRRKPAWWYMSDASINYVMGVVNPTIQGTGTNVVDAVSSWKHAVTGSSADDYAGLTFENSGFTPEGPHFEHLPTLTFHIRTGSAITAARFWVGLFDNRFPSNTPGTSATGVLTAKHVSFRYVAGTDTQWVASVADGTTQTVSANIAAIAASTVYTLKIRFISNTQVAFSVNGGAETTVTLASNAADATNVYPHILVANVTATNTRAIDISGIYFEYN